VLADLHRPVVITSTAARVGVHGMGGIGKSVLASVLARDFAVRRAFPDGVVWVAVGQNPTLVTLQRRLAQALGDPGRFESEFEGKAVLGKLLADQAVLVVLDDVWDPSHVHAFDVLGPRSRAAITTRDAALITALDATPHQVQLMAEPEALALLAHWAGCAEKALPPVAHAVMTQCGRLPLALAICGAMVRDGTPWADLLAALREADLEFLEHPHGNVLKSIKVSIDALAEDQKQRFAELSVFPPDETIPEAAVATLWAHTGGLADRNARKLLTLLERRSLVNLDAAPAHAVDGGRTEASRRIGLHDLLYDYATRLAGDPAPRHNQVLDAYDKRCPDGWPTGPDDGYFFTHLRRHLVAAGRGAELPALLLGGRWLEAKAEHGLVFDLPLDFDAARGQGVADPAQRLNLNLLDEAFRRDIHLIARHPELLFPCVWNHGWWYDCPDAAAHYDPPPGGWPPEGPPWLRPEHERLATLLENWRTARQRWSRCPRWIRSLRPPVFALCGAPRPVFRGHEGWVNSVAFDPQGGRIVRGSDDEMVRVWDASSGRELACLRGHEDAVTSVAFDPQGGRIVSGSDDKTVRVWDASSGRELTCLRGHEDPVTSVAFDPQGGRIVSRSSDKTVRVWDAASGACFEVIPGTGDVMAIAAGAVAYPWRAVSRGQETVIERASDGQAVAWFPAALETRATHPTGRVWAGSVGNHLYLIRLEGPEEE
jgi:hypothetical protein